MPLNSCVDLEIIERDTAVKFELVICGADIFLPREEYGSLEKEYPGRLQRFIKEMSFYLAATGKSTAIMPPPCGCGQKMIGKELFLKAAFLITDIARVKVYEWYRFESCDPDGYSAGKRRLHRGGRAFYTAASAISRKAGG